LGLQVFPLLLGYVTYFPAFWDFKEKDEAMLETIKCLDEMAAKNLVKPILGKKYSLDEAQTAHAEIINNSYGSSYGKNFFKIDN
jgi:NADPH2:quinone reductase